MEIWMRDLYAWGRRGTEQKTLVYHLDDILRPVKEGPVHYNVPITESHSQAPMLPYKGSLGMGLPMT